MKPSFRRVPLAAVFVAAVWARLGGAAGAETPPAPAPAVPPAVAAEMKIEAAKRAHVQPTEVVSMPTPPPVARAESKPPPPAPTHAWVPGHWAPVKGEWQWTAGEWQIPPSAVSVWIEPKFDAKKREWSAGYWQPDRPDSYEGEVAQAPPALSAGRE